MHNINYVVAKIFPKAACSCCQRHDLNCSRSVHFISGKVHDTSLLEVEKEFLCNNGEFVEGARDTCTVPGDV